MSRPDSDAESDPDQAAELLVQRFPSSLARLCSFTLYFPSCSTALLLSRRRWRMCLPLSTYYVLVDTLLHLGSWAAASYRLPSDAVLMVSAGAEVNADYRIREPPLVSAAGRGTGTPARRSDISGFCRIAR